MMAQQEILDYYARPAAMTEPGACAPLLEGLPREIPALAELVQGLLLHEHMAAPAYGVTLSDERRAGSHLRSAEQMLGRIRERDSRSLSVARELDERLVGTCRNFSVLAVAMLRAAGVPARARCGFGAYFMPGRFVDHWVAEYWHDGQGRWVRVDAQLDRAQRELLRPDFDVLDVPHNRFLIAGDAWALCRSGAADPDTFGIHDMHGYWFIAGNLVRDLAALNKVELLPWDDWGAMPGPDDPIGAEQLALFDELAALTRDSDASFAELRARYEGDERLRAPAVVFNAVLGRQEAIAG
jgi:hypothetical protein